MNMGGLQAKVAAQQQQQQQLAEAAQQRQSFLEKGIETPFEGPQVHTAEHGGVKKKLFGGTAEMRALRKSQREERKEARQDRRDDRKLTRQTVRSVKSDMRKDRNAEPFVDGSGPIVELTRAQKRDDRRATRTAGRLFKKQERTERRQSKKDLRTKQSGERATQKETDKINKAIAIANKLKKFNTTKNNINPADYPNVFTRTTTPANQDVPNDPNLNKSEVKPAETTAKKQSFREAFRENRNAGKKEFEWNGKKYHTRTKSEEAKKNNTSSSSSSSSSSKSKKVQMGPTQEAADGKQPENPLNIKHSTIPSEVNINPTIKPIQTLPSDPNGSTNPEKIKTKKGRTRAGVNTPKYEIGGPRKSKYGR